MIELLVINCIAICLITYNVSLMFLFASHAMFKFNILIVAFFIIVGTYNYIAHIYVKHYIITLILFIIAFMNLFAFNIFAVVISYELLGIISTYLVYNNGNISSNIFVYGKLSDIFISIGIMFLSVKYILLGSLIKSAIFPFNLWLYISMYASLPTSSLLHSSLLVIVGVLTLTLVDITYLTYSSGINIYGIPILFMLAYLNVLYGIIKIYTSTDIKCVIASSTSINVALSLLVVISPILAFNLLIYHALIKASMRNTLNKSTICPK